MSNNSLLNYFKKTPLKPSANDQSEKNSQKCANLKSETGPISDDEDDDIVISKKAKRCVNEVQSPASVKRRRIMIMSDSDSEKENESVAEIKKKKKMSQTLNKS